MVVLLLGFEAAVDADGQGFVQFAVVLDRVGEGVRVDLRPGVVVPDADLLHEQHDSAEATVEVRVALSGILKGADLGDGRGVGGGGAHGCIVSGVRGECNSGRKIFEDFCGPGHFVYDPLPYLAFQSCARASTRLMKAAGQSMRRVTMFPSS